LDSDSESDEEDVKRTTKAKPSQEKTPESNEASQTTNGATHETTTNNKDNSQSAIPQHTDIHLASLSQQVQQQPMQIQGLDLKQGESKEAIDSDDEDWIKEVTRREPNQPPPAPSSADMM
jgi:hypothetical protein